jgi:hypothetical protein
MRWVGDSSNELTHHVGPVRPHTNDEKKHPGDIGVLCCAHISNDFPLELLDLETARIRDPNFRSLSIDCPLKSLEKVLASDMISRV